MIYGHTDSLFVLFPKARSALEAIQVLLPELACLAEFLSGSQPMHSTCRLWARLIRNLGWGGGKVGAWEGRLPLLRG